MPLTEEQKAKKREGEKKRRAASQGTPEWEEKKRMRAARERERYKNMCPEKKRALNEKKAARARAKFRRVGAGMSATAKTQRQERNARDAIRMAARRAQMSETQRQEQNARDAIRMAARRAQMSETQRQEQNARDARWMAAYRAEMSEGERQERNDADAGRIAAYRAQLSVAEHTEQNARDADRMAAHRAQLTDAEREEQHTRDANRMGLYRGQLSEAERQERNARQASWVAMHRAKLSEAEREEQNRKAASSMAKFRADLSTEEREERNAKARFRMARHVQNMGDSLYAKHRAEKTTQMTHRRESMDPMTKQQCNQEEAARKANERAFRSEEDRRREATRKAEERLQKKCAVDESLPKNEKEWMAMTGDELEAKLKKHGPEMFYGIEKDVMKSLVLYYINSGYLDFDQYKEYDAKCTGKPVDVNKIVEQVKEEKLSTEELGNLVNQFYAQHSYTEGRLLSCACCGVRRLEGPTIQCSEVSILNLDLLRLTSDQKNAYAMQAKCGWNNVELPFRIGGDIKKVVVDMRKVRSIYESKDGTLYHLHPELVHEDHGEEKTYLCSVCSKKILNKKTPRLPALSIANGIDFGWCKRIGMKEPSLQTRLVLNPHRLYHCVLKISYNGSGTQSNYTQGRFKTHAILFKQDAVDVVACNLNGTNFFTPERLAENFTVYLLDGKKRFDRLAASLYGTTSIFASALELAQWFIIFKHTNPDVCGKYTLPSLDQLDANLKKAADILRKNSSEVSDQTALRYEKIVGSDVAKVQHEENLEENGAAGVVSFQTMDHDDGNQFLYGNRSSSSRHGTRNADGDVVRHSIITNRPEAEFQNERMARLAQLRGVSKLMEDGNKEEDSDDGRVFGITTKRDEMHDFDISDYDDFLDRFYRKAPKMSIQTNPDPENEKQLGDNFCRAFPHVFLLGKACGKPIMTLGVEQRSHLLHQFTGVASRDRQLIAYLDNVRRRWDVMNGVVAHVKNSRDAVQVMHNLYDNEKERKSLAEAHRNPESLKSKRLLKKYSPYLEFSARNISYGTMQGMKFKTEAKEMAKRMGPPTGFITITLPDWANPRTARMSFSTVSNEVFPSVFHEGCEYGKDGTEFMAKLREASIRAPEDTFDLPTGISTAHLAHSAISDPVTCVQESKCFIFDICSILLGLTPREFFGATEGFSLRRTWCSKHSKGIFGHNLGFIGVVEDHQKGTLHYHLLLYGGLSPYVLQRFVHIKRITDEIARTIDTMYRSKLPAEVHVPNIIRNIIKGPSAVGRDARATIKGARQSIVRKAMPLFDRTDVRKISVPDDGESTDSPRLEAAHLDDMTKHECSLSCGHEHQATCWKGLSGATGCRFCMPQAPCNGTRPIILIPNKGSSPSDANNKETDGTVDDGLAANDDESVMSDAAIEENVIENGPGTEGPSYIARIPKAIEANDTAHKYGIYTYELTHAHLRSGKTEKTVVWETDRPKTKRLFDPVPDFKDDYTEPLRQAFAKDLARILRCHWAFPPESTFWDWVGHRADLSTIRVFHRELNKSLEEANGMLATSNTILGYCTGGHNNSQILGGVVAAKSACV